MDLAMNREIQNISFRLKQLACQREIPGMQIPRQQFRPLAFHFNYTLTDKKMIIVNNKKATFKNFIESIIK
jgi:hypothetical protein